MKTRKIVFFLYVLLGILFIFGSILKVRQLFVASNFFLIPVLLLYYRLRVRRLFLPIILVLLLFYIRDIFLTFGFHANVAITWSCFMGAMLVLFLCLIIGIKRSKVHPVEILSFLIMYGFLIFLFFSLSEIVPEVAPSNRNFTYSYLLFLMLFLGFSFTVYIMKSHLASLWLMLAAASFLVSEISLFFRVYIIEDLSVNLFYPVFHVFAYYALVQYAYRRRKTRKLIFF